MYLQFELSAQQMTQIASYISVKDIRHYVDAHKEEYEDFLEKEENSVSEQPP